MSGKTALEQIWRNYTESDEYTTVPESQEVMDALGGATNKKEAFVTGREP